MSRRRTKTEPFVRIKVNLDPIMWALFCEQIWDPTLRRPRYGEVSREFNLMLVKWLEDRGVHTGGQEISATAPKSTGL